MLDEEKVVYRGYIERLRNLPMVALVTTGRTGSDFLQSLLDSHPQIATFNGHFAVYSEFFTQSLAFSVPDGSAIDAVDEFIGRYLYKLVSRYDIQEGKDCLGEYSNESFSINTQTFRSHLLKLMEGVPLNSRDFLLAIYGAYNLCLGQNIERLKIIFHHPHLSYEFCLFARDFPSTRVIFSSRDPRANFYSSVNNFRLHDKNYDNEQHLYNCLKSALEDTELAEQMSLEYIATRLEDLPREDAMRALAKWLGVDFQESLLRSTWAGLDWHGDRLSVKSFAPSGWSKDRTENNWQKGLGSIEKYVFNYIMNDRLRWYRYSVEPIGIFDAIIVACLIPIPFRFERRFLHWRHVWRVISSGSLAMQLQLILTPVFYFKRVRMCYKYYSRTFRGVKFKGNWLKVESCGSSIT